MRLMLAILILVSVQVVRADDAITLLGRDLSKVILTLPKPVKIYSYFNVISATEELNSFDGRQSFLQRFFDTTLERFWDMNLNSGTLINAGPGLYAAIDPHISQSFGNTMVEISVPAGTRYLDIHKNFPLGVDTLAALANEGIIASMLMSQIFTANGAQFEFGRDTLKTMIKPEFSFFRRMVQEIFNRQNVVMAEYNWDTSLSGFCRVNSYSAFVIFGSRHDDKMADPFGKTLVFKSLLPALTEQEVSAANDTAKFKEVLQGVKERRTYRDKVNFVNRHYTSQEKADVANQTYSCEL